jgi:hypothetical protein
MVVAGMTQVATTAVQVRGATPGEMVVVGITHVALVAPHTSVRFMAVEGTTHVMLTTPATNVRLT